MRVFITGINGVLGSVLKNKLRSQGHDVYGCDLTHSADPNIVRADVAERRQLTSAMSRWGMPDFDLVFHLAGEFGRLNSRDFYETMWRTNCIGTKNVIEECVCQKTKMVFASSSEAYGLSEDYSRGQSLEEVMLDHHPPQFHSEYALSKYTNERQIFMAARNEGLDAIVLRFFNVYGPPERYSPYRSVVCQFIYKLLASEPMTVNKGGYRSHLWIDDWAMTVSNIADRDRLNSLAMNQYWPGSGKTSWVPVFNIGGHEYGSNVELYERILSKIPYAEISQVRFTETEEANSATKRPDCSMAATWLDHNPKTSLDDGLRETIKWMRKEYGL